MSVGTFVEICIVVGARLNSRLSVERTAITASVVARSVSTRIDSPRELCSGPIL